MATNNVTEIGRLTRDPELKYTTKGTALCKFGLACNEKVGENEKSHFFDVTCWASLAEGVKDLKKGDAVIVVGSLDYQSWDDKASGQKRSSVSIKAIDVGLSIYAKAHAENGPKAERRVPFGQPKVEQPARPAPSAKAEAATKAGDVEDDVPF